MLRSLVVLCAVAAGLVACGDDPAPAPAPTPAPEAPAAPPEPAPVTCEVFAREATTRQVLFGDGEGRWSVGVRGVPLHVRPVDGAWVPARLSSPWAAEGALAGDSVHYALARPRELQGGAVVLPERASVVSLRPSPEGLRADVALRRGLHVLDVPVTCDDLRLGGDREAEILPGILEQQLVGPRVTLRTSPAADAPSVELSLAPDGHGFVRATGEQDGHTRVELRLAGGAGLAGWVESARVRTHDPAPLGDLGTIGTGSGGFASSGGSAHGGCPTSRWARLAEGATLTREGDGAPFARATRPVVARVWSLADGARLRVLEAPGLVVDCRRGPWLAVAPDRVEWLEGEPSAQELPAGTARVASAARVRGELEVDVDALRAALAGAEDEMGRCFRRLRRDAPERAATARVRYHVWPTGQVGRGLSVGGDADDALFACVVDLEEPPVRAPVEGEGYADVDVEVRFE